MIRAPRRGGLAHDVSCVFGVLLLVAGSACFSACSSNPSSSTGVGNPGLTKDEQALVDDGNDANDSASTASVVTSIPTFAFTKPAEIATPTLATDTAAFSVDAFAPLSPACAVATKTTTTELTYTFTDCTGPLGLVHIDGQLIVDYSTEPSGGVHFDMHTVGLTLNGVAASQTANGTFDIDAAGTKTLIWSGEFDGTTLRGYPVKHTANYTILADTSTGCVVIGGASTTTITRDGGDHGFTMHVDNYQHCGPRTACPTAGTIELTTLDGKLDLTVEFLPGRLANITTPRGTVKDWPLKCT